MQINIGADELILWLRKNGKATGISNEQVGNDISNLIQKKLNGTIIARDQVSYWQSEDNSKNIGEYNLPKTAAQYSINTNSLAELFETLDKW